MAGMELNLSDFEYRFARERGMVHIREMKEYVQRQKEYRQRQNRKYEQRGKIV